MSDFSYLKDNPITNKATPTYGIAHVTNANPIMAAIGMSEPNELNILRTTVFDKKFDWISLSPITLETIVINQKAMYGKADKPPF